MWKSDGCSDMQRSVRQQTSLQTGSSVDCLLCSAAKPTIFVWLCRICFACAAYKNAFCFSFMCISAFFASFLLCTLLFLLKSVAKRSISTKKNVQETSSPEPSLNDICDTCLLLLVRIGVLLMFFSILSEFLTIATPQSTAQTILIGMLEMTTGISKISSLNALSLRYKSAICLFLLGFGGICVHIQVRQAWQQSDFPIFRYILVRFLFGLCSSLCFLFLNS